jgi:hypothetical protein
MRATGRCCSRSPRWGRLPWWRRRYPKDTNAPAGSPLNRTVDLVQAFFSGCGGPECLPLEGRNLVAYQMHSVSAPRLAEELRVARRGLLMRGAAAGHNAPSGGRV